MSYSVTVETTEPGYEHSRLRAALWERSQGSACPGTFPDTSPVSDSESRASAFLRSLENLVLENCASCEGVRCLSAGRSPTALRGPHSGPAAWGHLSALKSRHEGGRRSPRLPTCLVLGAGRPLGPLPWHSRGCGSVHLQLAPQAVRAAP